MEKQINSMVAGIVSNDIGLDSNINDDRGSGLKFGVVRLAVVCLFAVALSPSMTQAQASAGVPVIKITKEDSSIKFNVKASVAIDGTFDKWDATIMEGENSHALTVPAMVSQLSL